MIVSLVAPELLTPADQVTFTPLGLVAGGILVGFGTRLGNGCTSGHGLCGLSRLSPRSLVAVLTFMASGAVSSYLCNETFLKSYFYSASSIAAAHQPPSIAIAAMVTILCSTYRHEIEEFFTGSKSTTKKASLSDHVVTILCSTLFGVGLAVSGMCNPTKVTRFLNFTGTAGFDPSLMAVMGSGVIGNLISMITLRSKKIDSKPIPLATSIKHYSQVIKLGLDPCNMKIDMRLILGSALFGIGWGMVGICPGPGLVSLGAGTASSLYFVSAMVTGIFLHNKFFN